MTKSTKSTKTIIGVNAKRVNDQALEEAKRAINRVALDLSIEDLIALGLTQSQAEVYHNSVRLIKALDTQYFQRDVDNVKQISDRFSKIEEFQYETLGDTPNISNETFELLEAEFSEEVALLYAQSPVAATLHRQDSEANKFPTNRITRVLRDVVHEIGRVQVTHTHEHGAVRNFYTSMSEISRTLFDNHLNECAAFAEGLVAFAPDSTYAAVLLEEHKRAQAVAHARDAGRLAAVALIELSRVAPAVEEHVANGIYEQRDSLLEFEDITNAERVKLLRAQEASANSLYNIYK